MNKIPFVSIVIPCRNEEKYIGKCLDSIIANDYPKEKIEILAIDGMSEDKTREILKEYSSKYSFIKVLENPKKIVPSALNICIKKFKGDIFMRMDAHNVYTEDYISKIVRYMAESGADNVGGIWITKPGKGNLLGTSIAMALSHPFGVGNSFAKIGLKSPKLVDSVPFGCYERGVFEKIGPFDENLVRNQDLEFNLRLRKSGGKILLVPDVASYYHARSTLKALSKKHFGDGFWVLYSLRFAKIPFSVRHLIPFIFVLILLCSLLLSFKYRGFIYLFAFTFVPYVITNIVVSLTIALRNGLRYFPLLFIAFATLHFSYGTGSIWGLVKLIPAKLRGNRR